MFLQAENEDSDQNVQTDLNLDCMHMPTCTLCWKPALKIKKMIALIVRFCSGLEVIQLFSCSTQLSMKFQLLIKS